MFLLSDCAIQTIGPRMRGNALSFEQESGDEVENGVTSSVGLYSFASVKPPSHDLVVGSRHVNKRKAIGMGVRHNSWENARRR